MYNEHIMYVWRKIMLPPLLSVWPVGPPKLISNIQATSSNVSDMGKANLSTVSSFQTRKSMGWFFFAGVGLLEMCFFCMNMCFSSTCMCICDYIYIYTKHSQSHLCPSFDHAVHCRCLHAKIQARSYWLAPQNHMWSRLQKVADQFLVSHS